MTSKEFIIWLKGFVAGSNNYQLTPQGWNTVKEELEKVDKDDYNDWMSGYAATFQGEDKTPPCVGHAYASDEEERELSKRMDVIGQNGNEGTHYWTSTSTDKQLLKD